MVRQASLLLPAEESQEVITRVVKCTIAEHASREKGLYKASVKRISKEPGAPIEWIPFDNALRVMSEAKDLRFYFVLRMEDELAHGRGANREVFVAMVTTFLSPEAKLFDSSNAALLPIVSLLFTSVRHMSKQAAIGKTAGADKTHLLQFGRLLAKLIFERVVASPLLRLPFCFWRYLLKGQLSVTHSDYQEVYGFSPATLLAELEF